MSLVPGIWTADLGGRTPPKYISRIKKSILQRPDVSRSFPHFKSGRLVAVIIFSLSFIIHIV